MNAAGSGRGTESGRSPPEAERGAAGAGARRAPVPACARRPAGGGRPGASPGPAPGPEDPAAAGAREGASSPAPAGLTGGGDSAPAARSALARWLPHLLPHLRGERRRAAPFPARPPLRPGRSCAAAAGVKVAPAKSELAAAPPGSRRGRSGEKDKNQRNSRSAQKDGARRADRGLRAAGPARSRAPPPPGARARAARQAQRPGLGPARGVMSVGELYSQAAVSPNPSHLRSEEIVLSA
nr:uncharacterized protein LOC111774835 [Equus caballus]